ncbi:ATP-grasp domain-containing protein [Kordiimonas sp.]|uniref:ATP-grasp domain-containing protein n=1 Tax=Kordiimonas sp. TaxID=1970157 RepID=UPI003A8D4259
MSKPYIASIGTGAGQKRLIEAAQQAGFAVLGIDRSPDENLCDAGLAVSTYDADAAVAAALAWQENNHKIQHVIARTSGPANITAAKLAAALKVPGQGPDLADAALSKYSLYMQCRAENVPTIETMQHPESEKPSLSLPVIIKPDQPLKGKENVFLVRELAELDTAIKQACAASINRMYVAQPLVNGEEFGISVAARDGKMLWHGYFAELVAPDERGRYIGQGVASEAKVCAKVRRMCGASVAQLLARWGTTGFVFFSFRLNELEEPLLFEVNPGLCGDQIVDKLFPAMWPGADFFSMEIGLLTRAECTFPKTEGLASVVRTDTNGETA